jgi:hypothetical protein
MQDGTGTHQSESFRPVWTGPEISCQPFDVRRFKLQHDRPSLSFRIQQNQTLGAFPLSYT